MEERKWEMYSYIVYTHLLVIGAIGNSLIIAYFVKINATNLRKMTPYHFLLTYLAVIDLLVSIGYTLLYFHRDILDSNELLCKYSYNSLQMSLPSYSIWILVIISYERYCKMVFPLKQPIRKKILFAVLVFTMVVCVGLYVPMMERNRITNNKCHLFGNSKITITAFYIGYICFDCLIPTVVMLWFHYKISVKFECLHDISKILDQNALQQLQNNKRKKAALKTLRTLIIMYVLFVFPGRLFMVIHVLISFNAKLLYQRHVKEFTITTKLMEISVYFNNIGNVFIYAWLIVGFRQFLKNLFTFGLLKESNTAPETNIKHNTITQPIKRNIGDPINSFTKAQRDFDHSRR